MESGAESTYQSLHVLPTFRMLVVDGYRVTVKLSCSDKLLNGFPLTGPDGRRSFVSKKILCRAGNTPVALSTASSCRAGATGCHSPYCMLHQRYNDLQEDTRNDNKSTVISSSGIEKNGEGK